MRTAVVHHNSFEENIAKINILFCSEHKYELLTLFTALDHHSISYIGMHLI